MEHSGRRNDLLGRFIERSLVAVTISKLQTLSTKNSLKWSRDDSGMPFGKESNGVLEAIEKNRMEFQKAKRQHKAESLTYRYDKYEKDTPHFL